MITNKDLSESTGPLPFCEFLEIFSIEINCSFHWFTVWFNLAAVIEEKKTILYTDRISEHSGAFSS